MDCNDSVAYGSVHINPYHCYTWAWFALKVSQTGRMDVEGEAICGLSPNQQHEVACLQPDNEGLVEELHA